MLAAALLTAGLIIWRDRTSSPAWQTVTAGLLLALMIAWSGHEDVLIGLALVLVAVTLAHAALSGGTCGPLTSSGAPAPIRLHRLRAGIIARGHGWYQKVAASPDSLADHPAVVGHTDSRLP
jgi:hypothetical protein